MSDMKMKMDSEQLNQAVTLTQALIDILEKHHPSYLILAASIGHVMGQAIAQVPKELGERGQAEVMLIFMDALESGKEAYEIEFGDKEQNDD